MSTNLGYKKFNVYNIFDVLSLSSYALEQTPLHFIPTQYESHDYSKYYVLWNFGDGSPVVNSLSASHAYYYPGEYRVTMTVMLSSGQSVLDSYKQTVTIRDFIPNTFAFEQLSGVNSTQIYLTAGVYSPELTINRFNSLQTYSPAGYTFFLNASGSNAPFYNIEKLSTEPYAHLLPTHRFIQREPVLAMYSDTIVDTVNSIDTNLYGKLDSSTLVVPTSSTDINAFFVGTSGYANVYFVDDIINTNPYYIFCTIDTTNFPDNYTQYLNLPLNYSLPIKNSNSSYYKISENVYANADIFNITSNGLDGEGFILSTFDIGPVKFYNQQISFVAKLKSSNGYSDKNQYSKLNPVYNDNSVNNIRVNITDSVGNILINLEPYIVFDDSLYSNYHNYGWVKGYFILPDAVTVDLSEVATVCISAYGTIQDNNNLSYFVSGSSTLFNIYPSSGYNKIAKINENFDTANYMKGLAYQPSLYQQPVLFNTFFSTILGTLSSSVNAIGKRVYEKTSNFISNTSNVDLCNIKSLYSFAQEYDVDITKYLQQDFLITYPADMARLIDIFSIKQSLLFGRRDQYNQNFFNRYTPSTTVTDLYDATQNLIDGKKYGNNLGPKINILDGVLYPSSDYIVAQEIYSNTFTLVRTNITEISLNSYPLSTFNSSWGWGLVLPDSLYSNSLSTYMLSTYYSFYEFIPVVPGTYVDNMINWDDSYNTTIDLQNGTPLSSTYLPSYMNDFSLTPLKNWLTYGGIVDQNLSYQLSLGVKLLSAD